MICLKVLLAIISIQVKIIYLKNIKKKRGEKNFEISTTTTTTKSNFFSKRNTTKSVYLFIFE